MQTTAITEGIEITVRSEFKINFSQVDLNKFYFEYNISIQNKSPYTVQLMRRDWFIYDSLDAPKYVSGPGVVGQQPVLSPGEVYNYTSSCQLVSEIGYMTGHYTFNNLDLKTEFPVLIPKFDLIYPYKLN